MRPNQLRWTNGSRRQQFVVLIFVSVSPWLTLTLAAVGHVIWRQLGLLVNGSDSGFDAVFLESCTVSSVLSAEFCASWPSSPIQRGAGSARKCKGCGVLQPGQLEEQVLVTHSD